jgi:peptide deformylase
MIKTKLDIKYYGDPVLNKISSDIHITEETRNLAAEMIEVMHKYDGVGLAAPQVGLNFNLIVLNLSPEYLTNPSISPGEALMLPQMPVALVNPETTPFSIEMSTAEEGCLSVPEIYAPVTRPTTITLKAQTLSGETINILCGGFLARALQHEIDHLKGKLFIDHLESDEYKKIKKKLDKLKKSLTKKGFIN